MAKDWRDAGNDIAALEKSIADLAKTVTDAFSKGGNAFTLMASNLTDIKDLMGKAAKVTQIHAAASKAAAKDIKTLTEAQKFLGIELNTAGDGYLKNGIKVNAYGSELNRAGEKVNNFNKRTVLMANTVNQLNKEGNKNISFMKGWAKYTELGGNSAEYLSEYLSSTREELTIFGIEAAKARKIMYGFLPPGMFRLMNKFSSVLQFTGGIYRKMGDDGAGAKDRIKELKEAIEKATLAGNTDEIEAFNAEITELQDGMNPNIVTKFFGALMKLGKVPKFKDFMGSFKKFGKEGFTEGRDARKAKKAAGSTAEVAMAKARLKEITKLKKLTEKLNATEVGELFNFGDGTTKKVTEEDKVFANEQLGDAEDEEKEMLVSLMSSNPWFVRMYKAGKLMKILVKSIKSILMFIMKGFYLAMATVLVLLVIVKTIGPPIADAFSKAGEVFGFFWEWVVASFDMFWEGIGLVWNAFFGDGTMDDAIVGLMKIAGGLLGMAVSAAIGIVAWAGALVLSALYYIGKRAIQFFGGAASIGKKIVIFLSLFAFFYATFWLQMGVMLPLMIGLLVYYVGKLIGKYFGFWAGGGVVDKPLQVVGEKGPELVSMAQGSRVYSNTQSKSMLSGSSSSNVINITINARDTSDTELRRIATKIGDLVNRQVNRGTSSSTTR